MCHWSTNVFLTVQDVADWIWRLPGPVSLADSTNAISILIQLHLLCMFCSVTLHDFSLELPLWTVVLSHRQLHETWEFLLLSYSGCGSLVVHYFLFSVLCKQAYIQHTTTTVITVGPNVRRKPLEADDGGHCEQHRAVRGAGRCRNRVWRWVARVQTTDSDGLKHVPVNLILQNADPDTSTFLAVKLHVSHCTLRICPDIWLLIMPKNVKIKDFWFSCHIFFLSYHGPYFLALCCI